MTELTTTSHVDIAKAVKAGNLRSILFAGPRGVGKTSLAFAIAEWLNWMAWKAQLHAETSPAEVLGMYVPDEKSFRWEPGPLDLAYSFKAGKGKAAKQGSLLILDEIIEASGPVKTLLYGALDDGPGGHISYVGREFHPEPTYHVIATMNGWPNEGGLPEALLDRFDATFIITKPSPKQLATLDPDLKLICQESYESAQAKDPMQGPGVTFRMLQSLQKLRKVLPLDQAVMASCQGDQTLATSFLEVLALTSEEEADIEDEEDEEDEE
jgi:midasin (ATPase involved in ribosome maturation)